RSDPLPRTLCSQPLNHARRRPHLRRFIRTQPPSLRSLVVVAVQPIVPLLVEKWRTFVVLVLSLCLCLNSL
uniref:Uncharacterized protein n=1 Tax=Cucumis melo TaxID=3656 RepID=A0A9I9EJ64_CUCME